MLIESLPLRDAVQELWDHARTGNGRVSLGSILESARKAVLPADRACHLAALAALDDLTITDEAIKALLQAIDEWWRSPSVPFWCRTSLPEIIVTRFPELTRYLVYGEDHVTPAMERTDLSDEARQQLILRALERHVDVLGADRIFKIVGIVASSLAPSDAAELADWYAGRLADRIPADDRDQQAPLSELPQQVDEAVARFLFAYMGDCDVRLRWRAAHAVRRLARTEEQATLMALVAEYYRREEPVFRGRDFAFYWLAARLWFVLAWDRVVGESPNLAACATRTLVQIALDESFPHLLVRSFAQDACLKLVKSGHLTLTATDQSRLMCVNETPLPRIPATSVMRSFDHGNGSRRFQFDWLDTIRYWYEPMLSYFADVDGDRFLQEVERWIIDVWHYDGDVRQIEEQRRRGLIDDRNWNLSNNSHGSMPTLERLNNHLEWHAMWCATGELLKTAPLASFDNKHWHDIGDLILDKKLVEPPLWSADLRVPPPLDVRNWRPDTDSSDDWMFNVGEAIHRNEVFPNDSPDHIVVSGSLARHRSDWTEECHVFSALVEPGTGRSLLRALQTMDDSWDYGLPDEGGESEISEGPYRFLGWLRYSNRDGSIDVKDPFRGDALGIVTRPGKRVVVACNLDRDAAGRPRWSNDGPEPMFLYEAWGEPDEDDEGYTAGVTSAGRRLLANKEQLLKFLRGQELDLIIETEVTRRDREGRRFASKKGEPASRARFARLYRLDSRGGLEIAEGHLGTWTGDSSTA